MERNKIRKILVSLEELSKDYEDFEVALMIFLRSDLFNFENYITAKELKALKELSENNDSIFDIDKEDIDNILESEED